MRNKLYVKSVRRLKNAKFANVQLGDKKDGMCSYFDPTWGKRVPAMTGASVKWHILNAMYELSSIDSKYMDTIYLYMFQYDADKNTDDELGLAQKMLTVATNPEYVFSQLKGHMAIDNDIASLESEIGDANFKLSKLVRTSPIKISYLTPLHGGLVAIDSVSIVNRVVKNPENVNVKFYTGKEGNVKFVKDDVAKKLYADYIKSTNAFTKLNKRTETCSGLMDNVVSIDLDELFTIRRKEIDPTTWETLEKNGWKIVKDEYSGHDRLVRPAESKNGFVGRDKLYKALAIGILCWKMESLNSRNLDMMEVISIAISKNPHELTKVYTAFPIKSTSEDEEKPVSSWRYKLKIYDKSPEVKVYNTEKIVEYIPEFAFETYEDATPKYDYEAINKAVEYIANAIKEYYVNTFGD